MDPSDSELDTLIAEMDKRRRPRLRITRMTTWAILKEVDRLMASCKGWKTVDWEAIRRNAGAKEGAATRARKRVNQNSVAI